MGVRCLAVTTLIALGGFPGLMTNALAVQEPSTDGARVTRRMGALTAPPQSCGSVMVVLEAMAQRRGMGRSDRVDSQDQACNAAQDEAIASGVRQCNGLFDVGRCACTGVGSGNLAGGTRYGCRAAWSCSSRAPLRSGIATGTGASRDSALEGAEEKAYRDGAAYCIGGVEVNVDGYSCSSVGSRFRTRHSCLVAWKCAEGSRRGWWGVGVWNGRRDR